jgi:hypothetical protein
MLDNIMSVLLIAVSLYLVASGKIVEIIVALDKVF